MRRSHTMSDQGTRARVCTGERARDALCKRADTRHAQTQEERQIFDAGRTWKACDEVAGVESE